MWHLIQVKLFPEVKLKRSNIVSGIDLIFIKVYKTQKGKTQDKIQYMLQLYRGSKILSKITMDLISIISNLKQIQK